MRKARPAVVQGAAQPAESVVASATTPAGASPNVTEIYDAKAAQSAEDYLRERHAILTSEGVGVPATEGHLAGCTLMDLIVVLKSHLGELSARAAQDPNAAETLHSFACASSENLMHICAHNLPAAIPWASRKMRFPVVWPVLKQQQGEVLALIKELGIGTRGFFRIGRKGFDPDRPANRVVLRWVARIAKVQRTIQSEITIKQARASLEGVKASLPNLSKAWLKDVMALKRPCRANASAWAEVIWQGILSATDGKPELSPELRPLGEHRAKHSLHEGQQAKATERTAETNIRDGIRKRIKQAVCDLSRHSPDGIGPE